MWCNLKPDTLQKRQQGYPAERLGTVGPEGEAKCVPVASRGSTGQSWTPLHDFQLEEAVAILQTGDTTGLKIFTRLILVELCVKVLGGSTNQFLKLRHGALLAELSNFVCGGISSVLLAH